MSFNFLKCNNGMPVKNTISNARDGLAVKLDYLNCWASCEDGKDARRKL